MKKINLLFLFIVITPLLLISCKKKNLNPNEVLNYLKDLKTYNCQIEMQVVNDKQTLVYSFDQYYSKELGYRLDLDEQRVFIYKEDKIYVEDKQNGKMYEQEEDFDNVFKLSFLGKYIGLIYTNEELTNTFKEENKIQYQMIKMYIPGNNRNLNEAILYVNTETLKPEYLYIFDQKGNVKIKAKYKNFQGNIDINEDLFTIREE